MTINPPLPPTKAVTQPLVPAKSVTAQALTPRTNPARSNVFDRLSQEKTVASRNWENEEQKHREEIEKKHWEDIKARPVKKRGGQSTKKKSRKSSHNKRHTKRAIPGKQQSKTRNKRTKRISNQTRKK